MIAPTVAEVKAWSKVDFASLDFSDDDLTVEVARACDYVADVTGVPLAQVASGLVTTAQEAIQLRVEQTVFHRQEDHVDTAADSLIANFSAGPYSEAKRDPGQDRKAGLVNPWPRLHDLLWRLMTEDKRDEWTEWLGGSPRPSFEVTEVQWDAYADIPYYGWRE